MSHELHFTVNSPGGGNQADVGGGYPEDDYYGTSSGDRPMQQSELDQLPMGRMPPSSSGVDASGSTGGGTLEYISTQLKQSAHPSVVVFHILFKALALFMYIFGGWFTGSSGSKGTNFITLTVTCILLLAADFWVVKNVTGRLLVGLRWWNQVKDDTTEWIFESAEGNRPVNRFDQSIFWTVLYITPVIWIVLFIFGLLKLELNWLLIVVMALALSGANVYGYYKCSHDQKARFQQMMQQGAQQGAMAVMRSSMLSMLTGTSTTTPGTAGPAQPGSQQRVFT